MSDAPPKISVIVPFYNEQDNIGPMHAALVEALEPLHVSYELVFVDDGSTDSTVAVAIELARADPHLRVVKFRRNYGQTAAMAAGIEHAQRLEEACAEKPIERLAGSNLYNAS